MPQILVDSSVWIGYLRPAGFVQLKSAMQQALEQDSIYTCWPVKAEILVGAKDEAALHQLWNVLDALSDIPLTPQVWEAAAHLGFALRRKGISVPLPDLLIAQLAIANHLILWHLDEHYEQIRRFSTLKTRNFLAKQS